MNFGSSQVSIEASFESAPITLGTASVDQGTLVTGAIIAAVVLALLLGARKEFAMFAVFAGVVGVIMMG